MESTDTLNDSMMTNDGFISRAEFDNLKQKFLNELNDLRNEMNAREVFYLNQTDDFKDVILAHIGNVETKLRDEAHLIKLNVRSLQTQVAALAVEVQDIHTQMTIMQTQMSNLQGGVSQILQQLATLNSRFN